MKYATLGNTEIKIPPIAFGGNVFGWTADEKTSFELLDWLLDHGFNYMDTANVYSRWVDGNQGGESETIIGKWMKERGVRDQVTIATKVGMDVGQGHIDLSANHIREQIDLSLKRLQTDYVDVYFAHKYDENTESLETLATFDDLIHQGKVRCLGASNFPLARFRESESIATDQGLNRYEVFQPEYNLMRRNEFEDDLQQYCLEQNIGVTSYFTLASGFLTGKYDVEADASGRARESYVSQFFNDKGKRVLNALEQIAAHQNVSQAAVTLAWTIQQPGITAPIASATSLDQLKAFQEAVELNLSPAELESLRQASRVD
ncbi:aldo/keto reductase [Nonlabens xiamenensis]|uniref:aldo/keto reductase n=1 Tax=Nonlabens xiamenensis TaxID=2341043 RepID=UPI000F60D3D1|nr:aldo/keto reductase [Nonlabens xiamenensis]